MDIIISANEKILTVMQGNKLSKHMTEQEYAEWLNELIKAGTEIEEEI